MIEAISAGLSSLNAAMGLVKALNGANTQATINEVKLDLQERIFEAREALSTAREANTASLDRIRVLEQEIVRLKDWEGEKQRYELISITGIGFAYMPKAGMENGEPPHWLCTNCFDHGEKSIMQFQGRKASMHVAGPVTDAWRCNRCSATMGLDYRTEPRYLHGPNRPAPRVL